MKSVRQAAALPISAGQELSVLLVSSRRRGRWVIPKGWPRKNESLRQTAAREAREEAGVSGVIGRDCIGTYAYEKRMKRGYPVQCEVFVFPLLVDDEQRHWPERWNRSRVWHSLGDAAGAVEENGLRDLIETLRAGDAAGLLATIAESRNE